jgi:hypothetical protein
MDPEPIDRWLSTFKLDRSVHEHVAVVFQRLPDEVRCDLMGDPSFMLCDYMPAPHEILHVPMRLSAGGGPGRSIVLKRTINSRSVPFARWVIAHELAHAYLRHGGRWPMEDPESAADSLAAQWGFPRPQSW